ncbi:bifunctional DedA family/phosphatase PAP2 family protein [Bosea sp. TND4EK4]|uniref:bifunctional DedA family/phosphatase PAP2 family protein n=1 Tax=Bosea sp. TND4EK4 TaxID=1907408 RepID=UPI0009572B50|nr:bifunctional DedA family/phosphatase PAP2 family protein [Bosea sp. TND4EK4]SIR59508.1 undecaprenyl-diphosphatase [Bosea sp. TND4EK4]
MSSFVNGYVQPLLAFAGQNVWLVAFIVFVAALSEAIVLIGAIIPGTAIILAAAAIVGAGHLSVWPVLIAAIAGAIVGDGISYWMGHHYKHRIVRIWPFSRYPGLLAKGDAYFDSHGGKSVFIARFLPGVRAVVPISAGMAGMTVARFYAANVSSALFWAPVHVLPATALGASMAVLGDASGRLLLVLVVVGLAVAGAVLLAWLAWSRVLPMLSVWQERLLAWARGRNGGLAYTVRRLLDPDITDDRTVALLVAGFAVVLLGFVNLVEGVVARGELARADLAISNLIQSLRIDAGDRIMIVVTSFGDGVVIAALAVLTLTWLAWRRSWRLAGGLAILLIATAAFVPLLKSTIQIARPLAMYSGAEAYSFPSGHATFATTFFGFVGWLTLRGLPGRWRWLPIVLAAGTVGLIATSRIYLAAHWPSDVLAGTIFGLGTTLIIALVFRKDDLTQARPAWLGLAMCGAFLVVGSLHVYRTLPAAEQRYVRSMPQVAATKVEWETSAWATLPQHRIDLEGDTKEPIVLQWAGSPATLQSALEKEGWSVPKPWSINVVATFLSPRPVLAEMPVPPRLSSGQSPVLTLMQMSADGATRRVLSAWLTPLSISDLKASPVLAASVVTETLSQPLNLLALPRSVSAPPNGANFFDRLGQTIAVRLRAGTEPVVLAVAD